MAVNENSIQHVRRFVLSIILVIQHEFANGIITQTSLEGMNMNSAGFQPGWVKAYKLNPFRVQYDLENIIQPLQGCKNNN
jgi:hypothetical protein